MKKGFLIAGIVALFVFSLAFSCANASTVIDFGTGSSWGGTITALGGGDYKGVGIALDALKVQVDGGAPTLYGLNGPVLFNHSSAASLDFNTDENWITITGWVTDVAGNPAMGASSVLLRGSFTSWSIAGTGMTILFAADGTDVKERVLLESVGLGYLAGAVWDFSGMVISVDWKPSKGYYEAVSTDIVNTTNVPIPGAVWLLGSGLLGLLTLKRKLPR